MLKSVAGLLAISLTPALSQTAAPSSESVERVSVKDYGAKGDGVTDDLPAIERALAAVRGKGQRLLFPAGTYGISRTLVIPTETQIMGVGRGDPGAANTVIKALPSFPRGGTVVEMGTAPGPNFGVHVENMTIHGSSIAGTCLANYYSQEQSFGRNLMLAECGSVGLVVTAAGQNSGPFENLEIYPAPNGTTNANTLCVRVTSVGAFRGIRGLTCNAGSYYSSRPLVAMAIDGTGVYQDIHIEHFGTAVVLGSRANPADGLIFADGAFGPDVTTGLKIAALENNQNITLLGLTCSSCATLLSDTMNGTKISDSSLGWYLLGNGPAHRKATWCSNYGIGTRTFGAFRAPQVQLTSDGPQPTCTSASRGTFWFVRSPRGIADQVEVCRKSAGDTYSWKAIF